MKGLTKVGSLYSRMRKRCLTYRETYFFVSPVLLTSYVTFKIKLCYCIASSSPNKYFDNFPTSSFPSPYDYIWAVCQKNILAVYFQYFYLVPIKKGRWISIFVYVNKLFLQKIVRFNAASC